MSTRQLSGRSLLDKISFLGMLLLGIFLVVVSSSVLGASRWQSVLLVELPWLTNWPMAIACFAVGSFCTATNRRLGQQEFAALFSVGSGLAMVASSVWYWLLKAEGNLGQLLILWALLTVLLGMAQRLLMGRVERQRQCFYLAAQTWERIFTTGLLLWGTLIAGIVLTVSAEGLPRYLPGGGAGSPATQAGLVQLALVLLIGAMVAALRRQTEEWHYWSMAWALGLVLIIGLSASASGVVSIGIDLLALGLGLLIAADLWVLRSLPERLPYRPSWHSIPLAFGTSGLLLGHGHLQPDSGLFTIVTGLIFVGVGRRQPNLNAYSYVGLAALSMGAYELLLYQLLPIGGGGSGGFLGDRITLFAALTLVIALFEKVLSPLLLRYLRIAPMGLYWVAHTHWVLGSLLVAIAPRYGLTFPHGVAIWAVTTLLLAGYALNIGYRRWTPQTFAGHHLLWRGLGILQGLFCLGYLWRYQGF